jgi:hypothetical protein
VSAGQGANSGLSPRPLLDYANNKLLIVTKNGANGNRPALFRCDPEGANCTYTDLSAGQPSESAEWVSPVLDVANGKLLVVTNNAANSNRPSLFRCDLDGTNCTHTDISAGKGGGSGWRASAAIDTTNAKLVVATTDCTNGCRAGLFRCNLDGTGCAFNDISAGQLDQSGNDPAVLIDTANSKVLVATVNGANSNKPSLYRCDLNGTNCSHSDISAGQPGESGWYPSPVIDTTNSKILVATRNVSAGDAVGLFRCNVDGSGCSYTSISCCNNGPSMVFDGAHGKLLIATTVQQGSGAAWPILHRTNLDATGHEEKYFSQADIAWPSAVLNTTTGKLLTVFENRSNGSRLGVYSAGPW